MVDEAVKRHLIELLRRKRIIAACSVLLRAVEIPPAGLKVPVPIGRIVASCGIGTIVQSIAADGYLSNAGGQPVIVVNSERDAVSQRFIMGHEFAHWVLTERCGVGLEISAIPNGEAAVERLCDEFAATLLAPSGHIASALDRLAGGITFRDLENLCRELQAPLRAVLGGTWRSGALTAASKAILVLRPMSNPWGGKEWHLRIWRAYCPEWGFVPERRLQKIGLCKIVAAWPSLCSGQEYAFRENFNAYTVRSAARSGGRIEVPRGASGRLWQRETIRDVDVRYKVYQDAREGVFVVAMFDWSRPRQATLLP
jgi:hypothetical protein